MTTYDEMLKAMRDVEKQIYDTMMLPPEMLKGVAEQHGIVNGLGMRIIESPLARMPRKRKKLKRAWDANHGDHYVIVEVIDGYDNVAFMFNSRALTDYLRNDEPRCRYCGRMSIFCSGTCIAGVRKSDFVAITNFMVP